KYGGMARIGVGFGKGLGDGGLEAGAVEWDGAVESVDIRRHLGERGAGEEEKQGQQQSEGHMLVHLKGQRYEVTAGAEISVARRGIVTEVPTVVTPSRVSFYPLAREDCLGKEICDCIGCMRIAG